jgi:hypothetical protein
MQNFQPSDPGRVNAVDPVEAEYWCKELHCTGDQLAMALAQVGDHVTEVRRYLASLPDAGRQP